MFCTENKLVDSSSTGSASETIGITGNVKFVDGTPVSGVVVKLRNSSFRMDGLHQLISVDTVTNTQGIFIFPQQ